jgi:hypothetical protein
MVNNDYEKKPKYGIMKVYVPVFPNFQTHFLITFELFTFLWQKKFLIPNILVPLSDNMVYTKIIVTLDFLF